MPKDRTAVKILADSVGPHGIRLTTFEITFPRFILAELNTHRMLSRNSASSRAIPTEKRIQEVVLDPFVPEFNARVKGMGVGEPLGGEDARRAQDEWLLASRDAVRAARQLLRVDKSRANRLLEPFLWQTAIVSATDWDNFWALRDHEAAQPEFYRLAKLMHEHYLIMEPTQLDWGEWHLPLVFPSDTDSHVLHAHLGAPSVSAGRCARVSYDTHDDHEDAHVSQARWEQLAASGHWSPAEHPARLPSEEEWSDRVSFHQGRWGNFEGWIQLRKHYPNEEVFNA